MLVVDQRFVKTSQGQCWFEVKSHWRRAAHTQACLDAENANDAWRAALFRELARTGNDQCLPRPLSDPTRAILLQMAARENYPQVITLLIDAGVTVNDDGGLALEIAVNRHHRDAVVALLNGRASVYLTQALTCPAHWLRERRVAFIAGLAGLMKEADLAENLPVFDELVELAREPDLRPIIADLAGHYPPLSARLL
jgi:ankyrin repeat protein